jgi:transcriptional regulator CtsR
MSAKKGGGGIIKKSRKKQKKSEKHVKNVLDRVTECHSLTYLEHNAFYVVLLHSRISRL